MLNGILMTWTYFCCTWISSKSFKVTDVSFVYRCSLDVIQYISSRRFWILFPTTQIRQQGMFQIFPFWLVWYLQKYFKCQNSEACNVQWKFNNWKSNDSSSYYTCENKVDVPNSQPYVNASTYNSLGYRNDCVSWNYAKTILETSGVNLIGLWPLKPFVKTLKISFSWL